MLNVFKYVILGKYESEGKSIINEMSCPLFPAVIYLITKVEGARLGRE